LNIRAAFINEVDKMVKRKKIIVIAILSLIAIIVGQLIVTGLQYGFGIMTTSSTTFPILVLKYTSTTIIPLFTVLLTIDSFSGEFSSNTMKISVAKPITRHNLFLSKILAIVFFTYINLVFIMIFSTMAGLIFNKWLDVFNGILNIFIAYSITIFPMTALAVLIALICNFIKSGTLIFFLSIILFIAFNALSVVFPKYSNIIITSTFTWFEIFNISQIAYVKVVRQFFIIVGYIIMFYSLGYYLFDKKDL
jgi:ABC-2 type transport system permease protein